MDMVTPWTRTHHRHLHPPCAPSEGICFVPGARGRLPAGRTGTGGRDGAGAAGWGGELQLQEKL